jgi:tRNA(Ile)-lysidine synthase
VTPPRAAGLVARVTRAVRQDALLRPGDRCLVAVSGGIDSVALLDLLASAAPRLGVALAVGHVDHGERGAEGREAAALVAREAAARGLAYVEARLPPPDGAQRRSEATLRRARYAALARLARDAGCAAVAVAHHRDDQAETVLLRLLRGAGPRGLAAMAPARRLPHPDGGPPLRLVRPLLAISRAELAARVADRGLAVHPDPTNADRRHTRNALRLDLLPPLRARINPHLDAALAAMAALVREEDALLTRQARTLFRKLAVVGAAGEMRLPLAALADLPVALQRRLIRAAGRAAAPDAPAPTFAQVEAARGLVATRRGASRSSGPVRWPGGVGVRREASALVVGPDGRSGRAGRNPAKVQKA